MWRRYLAMVHCPIGKVQTAAQHLIASIDLSLILARPRVWAAIKCFFILTVVSKAEYQSRSGKLSGCRKQRSAKLVIEHAAAQLADQSDGALTTLSAKRREAPSISDSRSGRTTSSEMVSVVVSVSLQTYCSCAARADSSDGAAAIWV